jgi:hypothetical protein
VVVMRWVLGRAHRAATGADLQSFMTAGYLDTRVHALYDRMCQVASVPHHSATNSAIVVVMRWSEDRLTRSSKP